MLFGWLSPELADAPSVLASMTAALRTTAEERATVWTLGSLGIGVLERPLLASAAESREPARSADGQCVWMSGEAFDWPSHGGIRSVADSRGQAFRARLLDALAARGPEVIRDLDGEYQIAYWNPSTRTLVLLNDRFAALPLYIGASTHGTAFAGGVRGVLMAPGISVDPDLDAIQEAVSFGGYRLGTRTNIRGVSMVPPASAVSVSPGGTATARYWNWSELRDGDATDAGALMEGMRSTWASAMAKRLEGSEAPGLTLSGGLDSRAILAEGERQGRSLTALTYGVPNSDDVKIAARAARAAGAPWELYPLYADGWLERRTNRILETDGLMDLVDLMHTEPFDRMPACFDVYLSGYIGDVIAGSTWFLVNGPEDLLASMPYYGGALALSYEDALARAEDVIASVSGSARFAQYDHKFPQSISRITAAARPFATVRRPFVDYRFFEAAQRIPPSWRARHAWREQWLVSTYPKYFATIPNQQTGVPPQSSRLRWQATRVARFGWRRLLRAAGAAGLPVAIPERSFHPDDRYWSQPAARATIEGTILRAGSVSCDVFGRDRVRETVKQFFEAGAAPVQVIGALYVFEHYHQSLGASLEDARRQIGTPAC
jgi:asparagine synthase (glutamine-hydrolysing)